MAHRRPRGCLPVLAAMTAGAVAALAVAVFLAHFLAVGSMPFAGT